MQSFVKRYQDIILLILGCLACALFRGILLAINVFPFNSDEAIVGLMARHILSGERPIFFYGQAYMGSLDAFLVASVFKLIGVSVSGIRIVQVSLYLLVILTSYRLVNSSFQVGSNRWMIVWLLALPNVNLVLYTTVSLGGYGEMLLIGNLIWLILSVLTNNKVTVSQAIYFGMAFLFGSLIGLGIWTNALTLIYAVPAVVYWLIVLLKKIRLQFKLVSFGLFLAGIFTGSLPWWIYASQNGVAQLVNELLGSAVAVDQAPFLQQIGDRIIRLIVLGGTVILGMRPPWAVQWLGLPLMPIILAIALITLIYWINEVRKHRKIPVLVWLVASALLILSSGFIFTSFGNDPSGRYFLPITIFGYILLVGMVSRVHLTPLLRNGFVVIIIIFNVIGVIQCSWINPPGITTQFDQTTVVDHHYQNELINFLQKKGEIRGYANYWIAYPLAFQSNEQIIYVPALPYHQDLRYTPRDNRYALYNAEVNGSQKVAYITSNTPILDTYLQTQFVQAGVSWQETIIGDYHVFFDLSKPIRPADMGLGVLH